MYRRGACYSRELGDASPALVLRESAQIDQREPEAAARAAFVTVFSALVLRTAYRPGFATPEADDEAFLDVLAEMTRRYLFSS